MLATALFDVDGAGVVDVVVAGGAVVAISAGAGVEWNKDYESTGMVVYLSLRPRVIPEEIKLMEPMDHCDGYVTLTHGGHPRCRTTRRKYCN